MNINVSDLVCCPYQVKKHTMNLKQASIAVSRVVAFYCSMQMKLWSCFTYPFN